MKTHLSKAAEQNNAENLLIVHDKKLAERYTKNCQEHERHSETYVGTGE
jgi:phosphatidylserine/phosphatidylglycerophosphate/cardiolipin synthase-like enzyme